MSNREVLIIPDGEVRRLLNMEETIEIAEQVFKEKGYGKTQMPPKMYLTFDEYRGDVRVMPSYLQTMDSAGVKIVNVHPDNPAKYGLPTVMAVIVLVDPKNGLVSSIMDGAYITSMRTGAAAAVATKYLARKDSSVLGLVGAGVQARTQLMALGRVLPGLKEVGVWSLPESTIGAFIDEQKKLYSFGFNRCRSCEDCVAGSDVVSTVTPATTPMVPFGSVSKGTHINAMGADAPGKEELDPKVLLNAKVVVDDMLQAIHSGEINVPISRGVLRESDIYGELSEIVTGMKKGRESDSEVTIFDSTGLSLLDVSAATVVYRKARRENVGTWAKLR
jgi:alanine dehydrogenase